MSAWAATRRDCDESHPHGGGQASDEASGAAPRPTPAVANRHLPKRTRPPQRRAVSDFAGQVHHRQRQPLRRPGRHHPAVSQRLCRLYVGKPSPTGAEGRRPELCCDSVSDGEARSPQASARLPTGGGETTRGVALPPHPPAVSAPRRPGRIAVPAARRPRALPSSRSSSEVWSVYFAGSAGKGSAGVVVLCRGGWCAGRLCRPRDGKVAQPARGRAG